MFKVIKDSKAGPDGMIVADFKAGQEVELNPELAEVAVKEKWVKAIPVAKTRSKADLDAEAAAKTAAEAEAAKKFAATILYGSSIQPSIIRLENGTEIQLGELVNAAFAASSLTAEAWNDLPEDEREQRLADQLSAMNQPAGKE